MTLNPAIVVLSQDPVIREALLKLATAVVSLHKEAFGNQTRAILLGCGGTLAQADLKAALACSHVSGAPVFLITSKGSEELAVAALNAGISHYLRLPLTAEQLAIAFESVLPCLLSGSPAHGMVGNSHVMEDLRRYLQRAASFPTNVLITGETGTGKELVASFLHHHSSRAGKMLITINCAAIPNDLLESELFGHERGAFTGAHLAQQGKLQLADGGTVFLDEIGDLSLSAQAKILRLLETGEIQRLGASQPQRINVRFLSATNRDLEADPAFRRDLYFRLDVARVHLPPLRERSDDVLLLADHFRQHFDRKFGCRTTAFSEEAKNHLLRHRWPGNVRELRNLVEAAFIEPGPDAFGTLDLPARFCKSSAAPGDERARILAALTVTHWNRSRAAEQLQWSRMTLYRKMAQHHLRMIAGRDAKAHASKQAAAAGE